MKAYRRVKTNHTKPHLSFSTHLYHLHPILSSITITFHCSLYCTGLKGVVYWKCMWTHKASVVNSDIVYSHEQKRECLSSLDEKCKKQCHSQKLWVPSAGRPPGLQEPFSLDTNAVHVCVIGLCACLRPILSPDENQVRTERGRFPLF